MPTKTSVAALALLLSASSVAFSHGQISNEAAVAACSTKQRSDQCQYQGHHQDLYIGSCQYNANDTLLCVRNQAIKKVEDSTTASNKNIQPDSSM